MRGELFEGSRRRGERGLSTPTRASDHPRVARQRGVGGGFLRNAANPRTGCGMQQACGPSSRSKPSRWCETTRAERELDGWCRRPEGVAGQLAALGVDARRMCRWRGGRDEPQERKGLGRPVRTSVPTGQRSRGARPVCGRFEGERNGSRSAEEGWFATSLRCPGEVLEGPGPVTVEGLEGRRESTKVPCSP